MKRVFQIGRDVKARKATMVKRHVEHFVEMASHGGFKPLMHSRFWRYCLILSKLLPQ